MSDNGTIGKLVTAWIAILLVFVIALAALAHSEIGRHRARVVRVFDLSREYRVTLRATNAQFSNRWNEYLNAAAPMTADAKHKIATNGQRMISLFLAGTSLPADCGNYRPKRWWIEALRPRLRTLSATASAVSFLRL